MNNHHGCPNPSLVVENTTGPVAISGENAADNTVRHLVSIWQQLLCIKSVGLDDNYFDLGGDSILAVQLFAQIEKTLKIQLPLAVLFEAPTIRELAKVIREETAQSGWSSLVLIQRGGARPPFFCMHGAGGNVLIYRDLALHMGPDQPFYGLQSPGLEGNSHLPTTIEEMAALYVKEIQKLQPRGPYLFGGYCGGGTIALEVAQQFREKGESVALLAMFDTMNWAQVPLTSRWRMAYYFGERLVFHAANFFCLDQDQRMRFLREKVKAFQNRIPVWRSMLVVRFTQKSRGVTQGSRRLGEIWQTNDTACARYVPREYPGVITDFRPKKQYQWFSKPQVKWERLAKRQTVVVLPVYPGGMLVEPFVAHLAEALSKSIDEALRRQETN